MPKPVLSDSLFNADDVATAILSEANLQVANSNLGVTDISSSFVLNSNTWSQTNPHMYYFNGFVFVSAYLSTSSTPATNTVIWNISDPSYRPISTYSFPATGYQGDVPSQIEFRISGEVVVKDPVNVSSSTYYNTINGWYRID
tara:strand:+ start:353 stop:781 length:429 start_codon:yes stop_codon:yes gene_type:complete